ncbi:hypothetical protein [Paenibacillus sp. LHD-38]|nr:hypothetical protein [Paenibacillus sp. LHD-38]MDQ8738906.1 hypothetical protein [Paenibacillus sp. LHD-38]
MRGILISMLLLITVLICYQAFAEGDTGLKRQMDGAGSSISTHIRGMSP